MPSASPEHCPLTACPSSVMWCRAIRDPAVRDLLALTSWLINPADNVAALALLRTPWCGLGLNAINQLLAPHPERPFDLLAVLSDASSVLTGDDVQRAQHLEIALRWGLGDRIALP